MATKRISVSVTAAPTTAAAVYTVPNVSTKEKAEITQIGVHNVDATNEYEVVLYKVPDGGTAGVTNEIYRKTLAAHKSDIPVKVLNMNLYAGQSIQAYCATADKINVDLSAREITE